MPKGTKFSTKKNNGSIRICSIDPGYHRLGIAVLEKSKKGEVLLFSDCITTPREKPFEERLFLLGNEINNVLKKYMPAALATETIFLTDNKKTVMHIAGVRGVIAYISAQNKIPLYEYSPLQIKVATTGYGRSDKKQVMSMVKKLINMNKDDALDDEYDAIAVGLTCFAIEKTFV